MIEHAETAPAARVEKDMALSVPVMRLVENHMFLPNSFFCTIRIFVE